MIRLTRPPPRLGGRAYTRTHVACQRVSPAQMVPSVGGYAPPRGDEGQKWAKVLRKTLLVLYCCSEGRPLLSSLVVKLTGLTLPWTDWRIGRRWVHAVKR